MGAAARSAHTWISQWFHLLTYLNCFSSRYTELLFRTIPLFSAIILWEFHIKVQTQYLLFATLSIRWWLHVK